MMKNICLPVSCLLLSAVLALPVPAEEFSNANSVEERRAQAIANTTTDSPRFDLRATPDEALMSDVRRTSEFAMTSLWENENVQQANQVLQELAILLISQPVARNSPHGIYWVSETISRTLDFFGRNGTVDPGRISHETEDLMLEMMWLFVKENSKIDSLDELYALYAQGHRNASTGAPQPISAEISRSQTWDILTSENHHAQKFTALWDFTRHLKNHPAYAGRKLDDGWTVVEHHQAWTEFIKEFIRQRAKKGLFVEIADCTYNGFTLKGFFNFYDFADDPTLRRLAGNLLTLYFATWAQEQIAGVRGGGKSRMGGEKDRRSLSPMQRAFWLNGGIGSETTAQGRWPVVTSSYRIPQVVLDLAEDTEGRGEYEIVQRPLGRAAPAERLQLGKYKTHWSQPHMRPVTDWSGQVRYSYCTPDFIAGMLMVPALPYTDWIKVASQSRWAGVIFAGDPDARIFVQSLKDGGKITYNQQWGIQKLGTMILQRLEEGALAISTGGTKIWVSDNGLELKAEENGWIFLEAEKAYAAVRVVNGGYKWTPEPNVPRDGSNWIGKWVICEDEYTPVILEVSRKKDFESFESFQEAIIQRPLHWADKKLTYNSLAGDEFEFFADFTANPKVNGEEPGYHDTDYAFKSPFVVGKWDGGEIQISYGEQKLLLDFRDSETESGSTVQ